MRWLYRDLCINLYVIGMNLSEPHHGGINSKICLVPAGPKELPPRTPAYNTRFKESHLTVFRTEMVTYVVLLTRSIGPSFKITHN